MGPSLQQDLDGLAVDPLGIPPAPGSTVQGGLVVNTLGFNLRSSLLQDLHNLGVARPSSMVQGIAHLICVWIHQVLKAILHFLQSPPFTCTVQAFLEFLIAVRLRVAQDHQLQFRRRGNAEVVVELTILVEYLELEPRVQLLEVSLGEVLPQPTDTELAVCENSLFSSKFDNPFTRSCVGDGQHGEDLWAKLGGNRPCTRLLQATFTCRGLQGCGASAILDPLIFMPAAQVTEPITQS